MIEDGIAHSRLRQRRLKMRIAHLMLMVPLVITFACGCIETSKNEKVVKDATSAIRIGLDACVSKKVVQPSPSSMHAVLRNGSWHVWEQGQSCEVFSTDVDAATGTAGPCSVCVT